MWVKGELYDDFASVRQFARNSLDRDQQPFLFDRIEWLERVETYTPPGTNLLAGRARAENCDAWLFLARTAPKEAVAYANWYTLAFRPIFTGEADEKVRKGQLIALARRLAPGLNKITLTPVPDDDGTSELLVDAFDRGGWVASKIGCKGNWINRIEGKSFDEFWAERPGEVRSTYSRKLKKFGVETRVLTSFDQDVWDAYTAIYQSSWKGEEGSPEFLGDMARSEGQAGTLRLGLALHEGVPAAAQLWTVENGHAIIHKLAYREDKAETSAGSILSHDMFRHVIDVDKAAVIDYGTGDDRYKQSWMSERLQLSTITLHNPKSLSGLIGATKQGISDLVSKVRRG